MPHPAPARQSRRTQEHHLARNRRVGRLGSRLVLGHFWHRRRPLAYDHAWTTPPHQRVVHTVLGSRCVPSHRYALAEAFSPQTFRQHPSHRRIIVRCRWQNRLAYRKPCSLAITLTHWWWVLASLQRLGGLKTGVVASCTSSSYRTGERRRIEVGHLCCPTDRRRNSKGREKRYAPRPNDLVNGEN